MNCSFGIDDNGSYILALQKLCGVGVPFNLFIARDNWIKGIIFTIWDKLMSYVFIVNVCKQLFVKRSLKFHEEWTTYIIILMYKGLNMYLDFIQTRNYMYKYDFYQSFLNI